MGQTILGEESRSQSTARCSICPLIKLHCCCIYESMSRLVMHSTLAQVDVFVRSLLVIQRI